MFEDIAVVTTAWRRPYYLRPTLRTWRSARGIMGTHSFTVALRDSTRRQEQLSAIRSVGRLVTEVLPDQVPEAGMHRAIRDAADYIFRNKDVDFLIFGEEDVEVATDILEYFAWADATFRRDPRVLLVNAHNQGGQGWDPHVPVADDSADPWSVRLLPYFNAWGWGTWRSRWGVLREKWFTGPITASKQGYDWGIQSLIEEYGFVCPTPDASRTQYTGRLEGVYSTAATFAFSQSLSYRAYREPGIYLLRT